MFPDSISRPFPWLQDLRVCLGELYTAKHLGSLLFAQICLPVVQVRKLAENLSPVCFKPLNELRQIFKPQGLYLFFQFFYAHGPNLPFNSRFANEKIGRRSPVT